MKYFCFNGPSPHASLWDKTGGDLRFLGYISPESLEGTSFSSSNITKKEVADIIYDKIGIFVPVVDDKFIKGVATGDHIICFCTEDEKVILDSNCESVRIRDFEIVPRY